jgi:HPt (histidine-containing phosphotransfer) domain-containing protein
MEIRPVGSLSGETMATDPFSESDMPAEVLDPEQLDMLRGIPEWGEASVRVAINAFLDQTPPLVRRISEAIAANNPHDLMRAAHTLKGSAASLGLMRLTWTAHTIILDLRAQRSDRFPALARMVESETELATAALVRRLEPGDEH